MFHDTTDTQWGIFGRTFMHVYVLRVSFWLIFFLLFKDQEHLIRCLFKGESKVWKAWGGIGYITFHAITTRT